MKKYGNEGMEQVNKEWLLGKYKSGNDIFSTSNPWNATGSFANEIKWLNDIGIKGWEQIGKNLWKLIR